MKFLGTDIVRTSDSASAFAGGGSGDVVGPASSVDNTLPRFNGTGGKLLQAGKIVEDDDGNIGVGGAPEVIGGMRSLAVGGLEDGGVEGLILVRTALGVLAFQLASASDGGEMGVYSSISGASINLGSTDAYGNILSYYGADLEVAADGAAAAYFRQDGTFELALGPLKFPDGTEQASAGGRGTATVNFGAFPGASDASATITGQAAIAAGSRVRAWIEATATADHTADEHWLETIDVAAGNVAAGIGFTIYAKNTGTLSEPVLERWADTRLAGPGTGINQIRPETGGGKGTRLYGEFTVGWEWI